MSTWEQCQQHLKTVFTEQDLNRYLGSLQIEETPEEVLLLAPNTALLDQVRNRLLRHIQSFFRDYDSSERHISLRVGAAADAPAPSGGALPHALEARPQPQLCRDYVFEKFVRGPSNAIAAKAAEDAALRPGSHNPLFISGGVGLGKTHLLQAIARATLARRPAAAVLYVHGERFVQEAVDAICSGNASLLRAFKDLYRSVDTLLVDDIWFLAGKKKCEQEFLHTLSSLVGRGAQVVIASDKLPREHLDMDARLRSRLSGGLHAIVDAPDLDTRLRILRQKAGERGAALPPDAAEFIAENIRGSVRDLESALACVHAQASHENSPVTLACARKSLEKHAAPRRIPLSDIKAAVCRHFEITEEQLCSASRRRGIVQPRQIAMALTASLTSLSLVDIGEGFGGRDHTTVMHARDKVRKAEGDDAMSGLWEAYARIRQSLLN